MYLAVACATYLEVYLNGKTYLYGNRSLVRGDNQALKDQWKEDNTGNDGKLFFDAKPLEPHGVYIMDEGDATWWKLDMEQFVDELVWCILDDTDLELEPGDSIDSILARYEVK